MFASAQFIIAAASYKLLADSLLESYECKCGSSPYTDGLLCPVCDALQFSDRLDKWEKTDSVYRATAIATRTSRHKNKPTVYVASKVKHASVWRDFRDSGVNIISSWIDAPDPEEINLEKLWTAIQMEVAVSDILVLFVTSEDFPLKGALIEIGMALANNIPVVVVASGVRITGDTDQPFGSWVRHKYVHFKANLTEVMTDLLARIPADVTPVLWQKENSEWKSRLSKKRQMQNLRK